MEPMREDAPVTSAGPLFATDMEFSACQVVRKMRTAPGVFWEGLAPSAPQRRMSGWGSSFVATGSQHGNRAQAVNRLHLRMTLFGLFVGIETQLRGEGDQFGER